MDVLYFAWVREMVGTDRETLDPPEGIRDVAGLIDWLAARSPGHGEALRDPARLRAAIDRRMVPLEAPLGEAREIAIFPPVTGG